MVVDEQGREVLRDPDPLGQMLSVHLAAAAPALRDSLRELAQRLRNLEQPYSRDARRVELAEMELAWCRPEPSAYLHLVGERPRQLELDTGDADEVA